MNRIEPLKAWAHTDAFGIPRFTVCKHKNDSIPVLITDARWMTRAEFEAEPVKSPFGFWVWHLTDGIGRVGWSDYCLEEREFVQHEDYLNKERVTHVLRIHPPQPPEQE